MQTLIDSVLLYDAQSGGGGVILFADKLPLTSSEYPAHRISNAMSSKISI